jgi:hypothetical protein
MNRTVKRRLLLAAFILLLASLLVTLVRPRLPGTPVSGAELIAIAIQIVLMVIALRKLRA